MASSVPLRIGAYARRRLTPHSRFETRALAAVTAGDGVATVCVRIPSFLPDFQAQLRFGVESRTVISAGRGDGAAAPDCMGGVP